MERMDVPFKGKGSAGTLNLVTKFFLFEVLTFFPMLNISYNSCHWKIQKLSGKRMHLS